MYFFSKLSQKHGHRNISAKVVTKNQIVRS